MLNAEIVHSTLTLSHLALFIVCFRIVSVVDKVLVVK